jgi:apolipoprotein N-acyltransferase
MMSKESREPVAETIRLPQSMASTGRESPLASVRQRKGKVIWLSLATGALLWCCYYPANCGWLAWFALVPLLGLVRSTASARRIGFAAWACGIVCYGPALQWLRVADERMYFTWAGLALYCSIFIPATIYVLRWFDRRIRLPLVLTFPLLWTALEYFRAHFGTGFPWYFLGHTQHDFLAMIQVSDLAGAYAVTFLVAAVNATIFEWLYTAGRVRAFFGLREPAPSVNRLRLLGQSVAVLALLAAALGYGLWCLGQVDFASGPRVALIQGNLPQRIRNDASNDQEAAATNVLVHYRDLCDQAARAEPKPDLIVWPETSYPHEWADISPDLPEARIPDAWRQSESESRDLAHAIAKRWKTNVLLGLNRAFLRADAPPRSYNSAILIDRDGRVLGHYDKIHCVPFGEYVPLREWLPWMNVFAPYDFEYSISPGENLTRFALDGYHFGVVICYEDTDPYLARQYVRPNRAEPAVDFLLNISNDGWFDGSSEHEQHLAICRFRAVECRRAVARAVNMGISAVIDGNGRVIALPGPSPARSKKIAAVLTASIPIDQRTSLYARWGDWLPWICWLTIGGALIWSIIWPTRRPRSMLGSDHAAKIAEGEWA